MYYSTCERDEIEFFDTVGSSEPFVLAFDVGDDSEKTCKV
jgi:hypothetical protein